MNTEQAVAAEWFGGVFGEAPPRARPWKLIAHPHPGDPDVPLYEVDRRNWTVHLYLHEGQMRAWESDRRFTYMLAGTQGGKTSFLPWLLARIILDDEDGGDYLAVTSTFDLFKLKLLPTMREVFEDVLGIARYWAGDKVMELCNPVTGLFDAQYSSDKMWGRILLRSASSGGGLEAATAKAALLDECGQDEFPYSAYQAVIRRLSLAEGPIVGGTTLYNLGWLKQVIYDPWERNQLPDTAIITFASIINPAFPKAEYERARQTMQKHEFEMQYLGIFGRPAAAILHMFIDKLKHEGGHLVKRFDIPKEWARHQAIDPGIIHTTKGWFALDPHENVLYLYRTQMGERKPATDHAKDDLALEGQQGERVVMRAIGAVSEKYWREDYVRAGAQGVKAPDTNDVEEGIDRIVTLLNQHRLYIFDDEHDMIRQMLEYAREVDELGQPTDKIKDKEKFHYVDMLRYEAIQAVKPVSKAKSARGRERYA